MKTSKLLILIFIITLFSCKEQNEKKVKLDRIDFYDSYGFKKHPKCNLPEVYKEFYIKKGIFCSSDIVLFNDSTYESESGCEAHSHRSTGRWYIKNKLLTLYPNAKDKFEFICNIKVNYSNNSKDCIIYVKNKYGKPVAGFCILCYDTTKLNSKIREEKKVDFNSSNNDGLVFIDKIKYDSVIFQTLDTVINKNIAFKSILLPDSMTFTINTISEELYCYPTYEFDTTAIIYKFINGIIDGWEQIK